MPVTDEALTQCIKTLRRQLGDDAAQPALHRDGAQARLPLHRAGRTVGDDARRDAARGAAPSRYDWRQFLLLGGAGTIGGGVAGLIGGLFYGFAGASQPLGPGMGAASVLLVLLWLTIAAALIGGAGVSFGIAAAGFARGRRVDASLGGALGGLVVGGVVKLLGLDAFNLLLGHSPGDITGAAEGALLGGAVGLGAWLGSRGAAASLRRGVAIAGAGRRRRRRPHPAARRAADGRQPRSARPQLSRTRACGSTRSAALFGESGFGPVSQIVTGGLEGALFGGCIVGAMILARSGCRGAASAAC